MRAIRIGNDIRIKWPIILSGDAAKLNELDLTVVVRPSARTIDTHNYVDAPKPREVTVMMNGGVAFRPDIGDGGGRHWPRGHPGRPPRPCPPAPVPLPYRIEDNTLIAMWTADRQFATGDYDIILYARKGKGGQSVCDQYRFVRLVSHTAEADAPCGSGVEAVIAMQPVTLELSGLSAYEIAVIHGFEGTEEEWVESLKPDIKPPALVGTIDISALDSLCSADHAKAAAPMAYVVTAGNLAGTATLSVGWMVMFSDNMGHVLTQELHTHYLLGEGGTFDGSHRDDTAYTYVRSYNFNGAPGLGGVPAATWTPWRLKDRYEGEAAFMGVAAPGTVPVAHVGYGRAACYIAHEAGTYANFKDFYGETVSLAEGEVALLWGEYVDSSTATWKKTTLCISPSPATPDKDGLMSKEDKRKLDGLVDAGDLATATEEEVKALFNQ